MNYELSYREKHKLNESDLTVAQRTLHFIAENMRMEKSISEDGYKHFQQAIEALKQEPCEKFESTKDHIYKLAGDYKCWDNRLTHDEALELCHILGQESILDKIRNEIAFPTNSSTIKDYDEGWEDAIRRALQIIDKYKAESEDKEYMFHVDLEDTDKSKEDTVEQSVLDKKRDEILEEKECDYDDYDDFER